MSHITKVKTKLRDTHVLKKALCEKGYRVDEKVVYREQKVDVLARKDGIKLGFKKSQDTGEYHAIVDSDDIFIPLQKALRGIFQAYARYKVLSMAKEKGYYLASERVVAGGRIEIVLRSLA
ncbi:MAG TPA: DUF1257 domain-containing protein [Thermococcus litoralis]|uniref:DUF1257 domain-containing protein n=1 Tax=Thermococcus litoralis TaxID=2265 RepID=A0A7C5NWE5_THELI|nr:DUF1257 domain-containing protein [Thermococcus litoralis]